ncbi:MAG: LPS export ABC transporter permease LptF [Cardiobacteriaceae bacterium]|nr:LPS export ABC transporter permease LptF [Cardiobacteriaceae bacterium]
MPIFYRYLLRETGGVFLATCFILLAIIVSFRLSSLLGRAAAGNMELAAVWQLIALQSVEFLTIIAPLAFVLASVMTLGRLYVDHEISALYAGGAGRSHLLRAFFCLALPIAAALLFITLYFLPHIYSTQEIIRNKARQEAGMLLFTPNTFRQLDHGLVVHTQSLAQGKLGAFFVAHNRGAAHSVIFAEHGELASGEPRTLTLHHGKRLAWQDDNTPPLYSHFARAELQLPGSAVAASDRLRNLPTSALDSRPEHLGEWQTRTNPALALLIFTLLLPRFSRNKPRQGRFQNILPAFLAFALYINLLELAVVAVKKGRIPPLPGSLWVHLGVLLLILVLWLKPEKVQR